jgi:hypothetical protein
MLGTEVFLGTDGNRKHRNGIFLGLVTPHMPDSTVDSECSVQIVAFLGAMSKR